MARYLDMLTFFGKDYADEAAAARGWQIDQDIVKTYRAGQREIAAKYNANSKQP